MGTHPSETSIAPKIAVLQRHLVFYREAIFHRLAQQYDATFLDSGLSFDGLPRPQDLNCLECKGFFFTHGTRQKLVWLCSTLPLIRLRPRVIITEASIAMFSTWMLFVLRPVFKWKILFWTHGFEDYWKTAPRLSRGDQVRKWLFERSDGIITYGGRGRSELRAVLRKSVRIFDAPNTIDTIELDSVLADIKAVGRGAIRTEFRMQHFVMVVLGRLSPEKEVLVLPPIIKLMMTQGQRCELHVIGDGTLRCALEEEMAKIPQCKTVFHGKMTSMEEKGRLLFAADCMVGVGAQGLSIVEALGFSCPLVTLDEKILIMKHGPEMQYVENGRNGIIAESREAMAASLREMAMNPDVCEKLRSNARHTFEKECDIERQWQGVSEAVDYAIAQW